MGRKQKNSTIKYIVPAVQKAFAILELFAYQKQGHTISEISRIFKLPVSTTSSLLYTLLHCGYLTRDSKGRFWLTPKLLVEGSKAANQLELREVARPELRKLTEATGFTSILSIRDENKVVCVDKIEGSSPIRIASDVGKRFYLHCSATGKALLAYLPEEETQRILDSVGLPQATENTITSLSSLKKELTRVRSQGYAIDNEENGIGIRGIGAPVFDHDGQVVAAICVGGSIFELEHNMKTIIAAVKSAAMEISEMLGYHETVVASSYARGLKANPKPAPQETAGVPE